MAISCVCPQCEKQYYKIKPELAGKKVRCSCGFKIRLPQLDSKSEGSGSKRKTAELKKSIAVSRSSSGTEINPFDLDYDDLDSILSRADSPEEIPQPSDRFKRHLATGSKIGHKNHSESKQKAPLAQTRITPSATTYREPDRRPRSNRLGLWLLLTLLSATLAGWLGSMLVVARQVTTLQHPLLDWFIEPLGQIYRGDFGLPALSSSLHFGFVVSGWIILFLAGAMILIGLLMYWQALAQLFSPKCWFTWTDGMLATSCFLLISVLIGTLFMHHTHVLNVNRDIRAQTPTQTTESLPPQLVRLRQQITDNERLFQYRILTLGILPASIFGLSMMRLFVREYWTTPPNSV